MNAIQLESMFAAMGARMNVREIPSRWRQGDRSWTEPKDFAVDLRRDNNGQFFELVLMNTETQSRTMLRVAFLD